MELREFITRAQRVQDTDMLWALSLEFFHGFGVRMVGYRYFVGLPDPNEVPVMATDGIPQAFLERILNERLYLLNPIPDIVSRSTEPMFWSDVARMSDLLEEETAFIDDVLQKNLGDGLAIPVFGPTSRNGLFQLAYGGARPATSQRDARVIQLGAQLAHLTYCKMSERGQVDSHGMTDREKEVLAWIAKGKSNSVIADILGISIHTVDTHVRRIFRKLGVNDRTTAAVKGLGVGVLQPAA
ncbi:LuxR family transcriptional regulator/LuxR family quorum-sensing system transcriptional regulator CciR [Aliiruegeria haliotis]|uniref:LuxR family transcriptional regulator/LuxR family quorum-sensing system transcriptional regulator CciR n=1 Tax=Aliiruegeria haliotis TaxID=1280846 RepID=A0A2T0RUU9_9RHOB|nr:LuxR family transcriptional regulator [Aliiruegeria haliotis]PRY24902.1 LuxR family transcriptional regulator/LuxR family quorum-sensing system transcriptional regulator CciR [Aliiruegeria haliotis]